MLDGALIPLPHFSLLQELQKLGAKMKDITGKE